MQPRQNMGDLDTLPARVRFLGPFLTSCTSLRVSGLPGLPLHKGTSFSNHTQSKPLFEMGILDAHCTWTHHFPSPAPILLSGMGVQDSHFAWAHVRYNVVCYQNRVIRFRNLEIPSMSRRLEHYSLAFNRFDLSLIPWIYISELGEN
jgi:hypothetical protein